MGEIQILVYLSPHFLHTGKISVENKGNIDVDIGSWTWTQEKNFRHDRGFSWVSFHFDLKELIYVPVVLHGVKLNLGVRSLSENVWTKRRKNLGKKVR